LHKSLFIWDSNDKPKIDLGSSVIFWSNSHEVVNESFSILEILESNSDQLKLEYLKFIYDLGNSNASGKSVIDILQIRKNLSFWWMTLLVEKSNWAKSPNIPSILKLMALKLFIKKVQCNEILIKTNNQDLLNSVKLLCKKLKINLKIVSREIGNPRHIVLKDHILNILYVLKGFLWFIREIFFSAPFVIFRNKNWRSFDSNIIFVTYLSTVEMSDAKDEQFNKVFWGPLPKHLANKNANTKWLYMPLKRFEFYKTFRVFFKFSNQKDSPQQHIIISSFFNLKVFFKTLRDIFIILFKFTEVNKNLMTGSDFLWPLLKKDVQRSMLSSEMVSSLFYLSLFESVKNSINKKSRIIYLSENQPWEVGLISSLKYTNNKLIAFAHSTIRYWDLRYFSYDKCFEGGSLDSKPDPDLLAVNGTNDKSKLIKFGYSSEKIREVESLRYLYLNDLVSSAKKYDNDKQTLLVLGDYLKSDTMQILSFLRDSRVHAFLKDIDVIIKPHPACKVSEDDLYNIDAKINNTNLGDLILNADVVFTGNVSSSSVEAYFLGKKIISVRNLQDLDMSPLRGVNNVSFVSDKALFLLSLKEAFNNSKVINSEEFLSLNSRMDSWLEILDI